MSSARAPPGSLLAAGAGQAHSLLSQASSTRARDARAAVTGAVRGRHHGPHHQEDEAETDHARGARRRGVGHVRRRGAHEQRGQISASRGAAVPSRHRRDSCPSDEVVGGFFFEFEAVRTESSDRDAPRRSRSTASGSSARPKRSRSARRRPRWRASRRRKPRNSGSSHC